MAKQTINIGSSPNDGTGDPLRTAFDKANDNFDELYPHISRTDNPHSVTAAQLGLGNVDNTSDADKPTSTATATAINAALPRRVSSNYVSGTRTVTATPSLLNANGTDLADR